MEGLPLWSSIGSQVGHAGQAYVLVAFVLAGIALLHYVPESRRACVTAALMLLVGMAALVAGAVLGVLRFTVTASVLHEFGLLLEGLAIIRMASLLLFRLGLQGWQVAPPQIVEDMVTVLAYLAFAIVRLRYAGLELSGIVTTSAVITGVIAFSMQDTLGNVLGGVALQLDSSLRVGDWIKVDEVTGKVVDIRWRSTAIETRNWETVVVPNSALMRAKFEVLGRRQGEARQWRRWLWFHVGYETPPNEVIRVVEQAVCHADIANVARVPAPNCVLMDFERLAGRYALRYWLTDLAVDDPTDSAVRQHIYAALKRSGVSLFVPESYRSVDHETGTEMMADQERELHKRLDVLAKIDLFGPLTGAELQQVASALRYTPFVQGDYMTEQGAVANWLYIITQGRAEVVLDDGVRQQHLGWIDSSEGTNFFGEMGLMTGSPRTATVIARTDVECYRLDKVSFAGIVRSRPKLAEELSHIIDARRSGLEAGATELAARAELASGRQQQSELLGRIKAFFNLA